LAVLTANEERYCETIRGKDHMLRKVLSEQALSGEIDPAQWLAYLTTIKSIIGNINNDVGFLATLLVKRNSVAMGQIADMPCTSLIGRR